MDVNKEFILTNVLCGEYDNKMDLPDSTMNVDENYVTNPKRSVLWNRERASKLKQKYLEQKQKYDEETNYLFGQFQKDLFLCIKQMYNFTDEAIYFIMKEGYILAKLNYDYIDGCDLLQVVYRTLELSETCNKFNKLNNVKVL